MGTMNASPSFQNNSQWNGRNSSGRQWSGGNYDRHGSHHRHRHGNVAFGFYDGGYYNDYAYDADCYRLHRVHTRSGWHWRRIYVCD